MIRASRRLSDSKLNEKRQQHIERQMASSSSQPPVTHYPLSLPLCKLSFCTTPVLASKMMWTHLPGQDDMFAVFDQVRKAGLGGAVAEKKVLKLVRGVDLLEEIDLHDLMFQARLDEERRRSQSMQESDLHIVVIIKRPLVAFRYQLPDGQVRRLQMNFKTELGYDSTVKTFESLGLPISNRTPKVEPLVSSQYPASSQPAYPNSSQGNPQNPSASAPRHFAQTASGTSMTLSTDVAARATNPCGDEVRPTNSQDYYASAPRHIMPAAANTSLLPSPDFPIRATTSCGVETHPTNSSDYYAALPSRITTVTPTTSLLPSPDFITCAPTSYRDENRPTSSAPEIYSTRPYTAPVSLSQMLPPKRVLPFPERTPKPVAPKHTVEVASSPPPQHPLAIAETPVKKTKPASKTDSANAPAPKPRKKPLEERQPSIHPVESINSTPIEETSSTSSGRKASEHVPTTAPPTTKTTKARPKATPKSRKANKPANCPSTEVPASQDKTSSKSSPFFEGIEPTEFMARLDIWVREYQHLPAPKPREIASEGLAAYVAQPREERMAIIDDMICDCLEDKDFIKLVEDVDHSWRRIGLGL